MISVVAKIPRSTFREHIAEELRNAILSGRIAPGAPLVEAQLAEQFGVSRGPLREAIRQLTEEGLLVTVPYTGTHVIELSVEDVREIYSFRTALESFAFEQAWDRRGPEFHDEIVRRHTRLTATIDAGDDRASILAELELHSLVYEIAGNRLLMNTWSGIRGRLQLYWAAHHLAHGRRGPRRDAHDSYVANATGANLEVMLAEIREHMRRGIVVTEAFLRARGTPAGED